MSSGPSILIALSSLMLHATVIVMTVVVTFWIVGAVLLTTGTLLMLMIKLLLWLLLRTVLHQFPLGGHVGAWASIDWLRLIEHGHLSLIHGICRWVHDLLARLHWCKMHGHGHVLLLTSARVLLLTLAGAVVGIALVGLVVVGVGFAAAVDRLLRKSRGEGAGIRIQDRLL